MSATLELKYFNTFWLKKVATITGIVGGVSIANQYTNTTYPNIPQLYAGDTAVDWYIEESRIRGGYNNLTVDLGIKAYIVEDNNSQQHSLHFHAASYQPSLYHPFELLCFELSLVFYIAYLSPYLAKGHLLCFPYRISTSVVRRSRVYRSTSINPVF